jgi:hypothetical protein
MVEIPDKEFQSVDFTMTNDLKGDSSKQMNEVRMLIHVIDEKFET